MRKPGIFPPAELCCSVVAARRPTDLPTLFLKVGIAVSLRVFYTTGFIFQSYEIKCNYRHFRPDLWLFADVILWCEGEICGCVSGFGFGGIAGLHGGDLPGSFVLKEHYRLGSTQVIVGRSFCDTKKITDLNEIRNIFNTGIGEIRALEAEAQKVVDYFKVNHEQVEEKVNMIVNKIKNKNKY